MAWEMQSQYQQYVAPSIQSWVLEAAKEKGCDPVEIALGLLEEQMHGDDRCDFEGDKDVFEQLPLDSLLTIICMNVDTMTNGAHAFCIGSGGWVTIPVCSEEQMLEYWA
jgi:hypothetical protein